MIKVIAFDYTNVVSPSKLGGWLKEKHPDSEEKRQLFKHHSHRWDIGQVDVDEFYSLLAHILEIPEDRVWGELYEHSSYNESVVEMIRQLQVEYTIALFSNNFAGLLRRLLTHYQIKDLFDHILISSDYELKKPQPEFFQKLLDEVRVEASEIAFIDDRQENVDAANELGIHGILFENAKKLKEDLIKIGVGF